MSGKVVVENVAKNVARLIGENRRLRGEVEKLAASREKLREENRRLASENADLEHRLTVKELAVGFSGGSDGLSGEVGNKESSRPDIKNTKVARARVNRLLREVDKCIGLLNKEA